MDRVKLGAQLRVDEGVKPKLYQDTKGKWTGGIGRNFSDRAMSPRLMQFMLDEDIDLVVADLDRNIPWWSGLNDARQNVLLNMCFNMGWTKLSEFKKTLAAMELGNWPVAAAEMLDSAWSKQVGDRAQRLAKVMREGDL